MAGSREPSWLSVSTWERSTCAHQKFLLCNQLQFSRRFLRLFTGSGLRLSGNPARNNLAAVLEDFPIPVATPLGIMRNSTPFPMVGRVVRPEMIIGVNLDTLYCAAFRAHEGAKNR
jgi:hypothetical protein